MVKVAFAILIQRIKRIERVVVMEGLSTTLTDLTSVFSGMMNNVAVIVTKIASTPLLFIPFGISLTYSVVRITKRLFF